VEKNEHSEARRRHGLSLLPGNLPQSYLNYMGRQLLALGELARGLSAFSLITLGVTLSKWRTSAHVIHPLIQQQIWRAGIRLMPIIAFMALALGFTVIGQTVSILNRFGAQNYAGTVMVITVVRELGPLITALIVLARVGTATVIELGQVRASGQVEALEVLGIDPIHYLVVPRVIGLSISIFSLTVYLILIALFSGYIFAFLQDVPLKPSQYMNQLALALRWEDFVILALKTMFFGATIAVVTCYEGLAKPLRQQEVAQAATRAVVYSLMLCVMWDAFFILYLLF
jgi:phospholipid/cholesterol/gamma-HCH transport system permease protein